MQVFGNIPLRTFCLRAYTTLTLTLNIVMSVFEVIIIRDYLSLFINFENVPLCVNTIRFNGFKHQQS